mmetsp:Transcript_1356/g.2309  ORF Transcript_1356/g.2309 Transcript_1356/m.2309 type:complete len:90 (-) Transcript_1356:78-347(-)
MRRVISPRLAMRILWNGGCCFSDDDAADAENVRLKEQVVDIIVSMVRGSAARCRCCADESHRNAAAVRAAPPFLQAVLRNKEDDNIMVQ